MTSQIPDIARASASRCTWCFKRAIGMARCSLPAGELVTLAIAAYSDAESGRYCCARQAMDAESCNPFSGEPKRAGSHERQEGGNCILNGQQQPSFTLNLRSGADANDQRSKDVTANQAVSANSGSGSDRRRKDFECAPLLIQLRWAERADSRKQLARLANALRRRARRRSWIYR